MANGYVWHPVFKQYPDNGVVATTDLWTVVTRSNGPHKLGVRYDPDEQQQRDINFADRSFVRGFRERVTLDMYIGGDMTQHVHLVNLVNRMAQHGNGWRTALSLNNGITYRDVVMDDYQGPDAHGGKTVNGAIFRLRVRSAALLTRVPYLVDVVTPLQLPEPEAQLLGALPAAGPEWAWKIVVVAGPPDQQYACLRNWLGDWTWVPFAVG